MVGVWVGGCKHWDLFTVLSELNNSPEYPGTLKTICVVGFSATQHLIVFGKTYGAIEDTDFVHREEKICKAD